MQGEDLTWTKTSQISGHGSSTILAFVYELAKLSFEEIRTMLGTKAELKKTRFYQEIQEEVGEAAKEEGKEELLMAAVPMGLQAGLSVAEIAKRFNVPVQRIKAIGKQCKVKI
jgi:predicted transposase YdaD